jgi:hypothetical protein
MSYTFDSNIVSDLHKDAYGVRPSQFWWQCWTEASDAERQAEWDDLLAVLDQTIAREKQEEQEAIADFERMVENNLLCGARDRNQAIRWILQTLDQSGALSTGYFCYQLGLPYSMEKEFEKIMSIAA